MTPKERKVKIVEDLTKIDKEREGESRMNGI
jgi:hypothetical protein